MRKKGDSTHLITAHDSLLSMKRILRLTIHATVPRGHETIRPKTFTGK